VTVQELQAPDVMTPDEAKTLLTGNFGKELHKAACAYCHPIFWALRGDSGLFKIMANGTAFVFDCGKRPFLVTAAHVYEEYVSDLDKFGERVFGSLGSIPFRMEKRLIGCLGSKTLDVATFEITSEEIAESGKNVLVGGQKSWPPDPVKEGEGVLFAGFPGTERIEERTELECNFGLYSAITPVSSVSERHFGCAFERSEWLDTMGHGFPAEGHDLGGISGCPVLALKESSAGVVSWSLAGVGYNATSALGEIFLVHHARRINPDGTLSNL
jgi:hypothetical protein